jgi:hypothetical protein
MKTTFTKKKIFLPLLTIAAALSCLSALAEGTNFHDPKCPTVVPNPKKVRCATKMNYMGQKFSKDLLIPLQSDSGDETVLGSGNWSGSTEFEYPGLSNEGNAANTIKAEVFTETHGNSPTCQVQQTIEIELNVLGYKLAQAGRKTHLKVDDGFGFDSFDLDMNCSVE